MIQPDLDGLPERQKSLGMIYWGAWVFCELESDHELMDAVMGMAWERMSDEVRRRCEVMKAVWWEAR